MFVETLQFGPFAFQKMDDGLQVCVSARLHQPTDQFAGKVFGSDPTGRKDSCCPQPRILLPNAIRRAFLRFAKQLGVGEVDVGRVRKRLDGSAASNETFTPSQLVERERCISVNFQAAETPMQVDRTPQCLADPAAPQVEYGRDLSMGLYDQLLAAIAPQGIA